ncbi:eukaryotic translation initiation factor eIF2A-domain-containing protein [Entophlyctis helioformis]|nr:eukaryotic translation initiation factor eIF2A-domain-containing protein [Entophlyctis helioformis]
MPGKAHTDDGFPAEFDPSTIDFSDLEAEYMVKVPTGFDNIVVVDHAPIVDSSKEEKLKKVIAKVFKDVGRIKPDGIHMPKDESGSSKGFLFIEFETPEEASLACTQVDGYKFDKSHTLAVNKFDAIDSTLQIPDVFEAPAEEEFVPKEHLKSWLTDLRARDQFAMLKGDEVGIYWNNKAEKSDRDEARQNWCDTYVSWSPYGTYLATFHKQGVALWGGPSWGKIVRFAHPNVKLGDFSPNEKYFVTWSHEGFAGPKNEVHNIIVWDVESGRQLRTFKSDTSAAGDKADPRGAGPSGTLKIDWPIFKWSHDGKYLARMTPGPDGGLSVYETPGMGLIDKKSIKIENVQAFEWSPTDHVISYWTPESGNIPARVTIIRTKNLFNVIECKLVWQNDGDYLLVRVDRAKTKKITATSVEVFRMREKAIPVDVLELKAGEEVASISWEPKGNHFAVLTNAEGQKTFVYFYEVELAPSTGGAATDKAAGSALRSIKLLKSQDAKGINQITWSPKGRFCVLAFWDVEDATILGTGEHYMATDVEWDPTGRYVVTSISGWRVQSDTGFTMWTFAGQQLTRQMVTGFKQFLWRPRPPTMLSPAAQKAIRKNLKSYSKEFDEEDISETDKVAYEIRERRKTLWRDWIAFKAASKAKYEAGRQERIKIYGFDPDVPHADSAQFEELEQAVDEVVDETEEIIG